MNDHSINSLEKKKWPQKSWLADHMEKGRGEADDYGNVADFL